MDSNLEENKNNLENPKPLEEVRNHRMNHSSMFETQISPTSAGFIGLLSGFLLYQFLGGILSLVMFGFDLDKAPVNGLRVMTMISQILFILFPAYLLGKWFYKDINVILRLSIPKIKEIILFLLGIVLLIPLLQSYTSIQNYVIDELAIKFEYVNNVKVFFDFLNKFVEKSYHTLLSSNTFWESLFVLFVVSIIPAVCEETLFRGFVQRSFEFNHKPIWAILMTSLFFGFYHFNPYGLIPLTILGIYFGLAAYLTKSIYVPMILHFTNNAIAFFMYRFMNENGVANPSSIRMGHISNSFLVFVISLLLFIGLLIFMKKYFNKKKGEHNAILSKM